MDLRLGGESAQTGAGAPASDLIKESSTAEFQADVMQASMEVPVLVDFWAPWCGPCKQLTPALEKVVTAFKGKVKLVKVNVDENKALAGQIGVQSLPTVFGFVGGRPVDGFMGAVPESEITKFAQRLIEAAQQAGLSGGGSGNEGEDQITTALEAADAALAADDLARAGQIYALVLQHQPDNARAVLGQAQLQYKSGDLEGAKQTLALLPADADVGDGRTALEKAIRLAEDAAALGDPTALEARLASDPDDHQARFDLAKIANARGDKPAAVEGLIAIMRRDREWEDDGARKTLLEFFEAWGPKDPATVKGRRMLSSLLFR